MKKSTVINVLTSFCILIFLVTFEAFAAAAPEAHRNHITAGCTLVSVTAAYPKIAPVFDTTGALVSDPTGTMWNTANSDCLSAPLIAENITIAPLFHASGQVVSDPTGIILNKTLLHNKVVPVTDAAAKIAPLFDATGAVLSDPTGTLLEANNS